MRLESMLDEAGVEYKKLHHYPTFTSQRLAQAEHVSGYNVAKPVVVKGPKGYAICVLAACDQLNLVEAAKALGERKVTLATEDEMKDLFPDCEVGAEPPVGGMFEMTTVVDQQIHEDDYIVMQAGTHSDAVQIRRDDWERICRPKVAPISLHGIRKAAGRT